MKTMEVLEDLNDDFYMKKITPETLEFPIVIKKIANELVLSVPDLGLFKSIKIPIEKMIDESSKSSNSIDKNNYVEMTKSFRNEIVEQIEYLWLATENHREEKKWQPIPSSFKQSLIKGEDDYSLPDFVKKLNQYISISENTVRREIQRGVIRCYQTTGGHRRIPVSEVNTYIESRKTKTEVNL